MQFAFLFKMFQESLYSRNVRTHINLYLTALHIHYIYNHWWSMVSILLLIFKWVNDNSTSRLVDQFWQCRMIFANFENIQKKNCTMFVFYKFLISFRTENTFQFKIFQNWTMFEDKVAQGSLYLHHAHLYIYIV